MGQVSTWADGFGRWHARVSKHAAAPLLAARRAIRDELEARNTNLDRRFWTDLERRPEYDDGDTIVYAEPSTERATCRHCGRTIVKDATEGWIDPEAGYDDEDGDGIWRTTCDSHDTFVAEHEPEED